jgi:hypothetical protein
MDGSGHSLFQGIISGRTEEHHKKILIGWSPGRPE